jgi:hypothetical protein
MAVFDILIDKSKYLSWITAEFQPRTLAVPQTTVEQMIDNAVRYWNTHSAYRISQMVTYTAGARMQLSNEFKDVVTVYPNRTANWIWNEFPTWSLAGVAVLDNVRTDLILATEAFKTFNIYVGADFRWFWEPDHDNPSSGGHLYTRNVPTGTDGFFVVGTKRILPADNIKSEHINDWILYYTKALVKMAEGHAIRATKIVLPGIDGQELFNEGKFERDELQKKLAQDGRWVVLARRQ